MTSTSLEYQVEKHLSQNPFQRIYLRQLAKELGADPGNLSRTLRKMEKEGIISKQVLGNHTFFSLRQTTTSQTRVDQPIGLKEGVKNYLQEIEPEMVKFTQKLVRTLSVSGENDEEEIAQVIREKAQKLGLRAQIVAKDHRRPNLVIDLPEIDAHKPFFLLLGHMDTIGAGEVENWRYFPFSGHIAGGKLYGRGTQDMKAGIVCEIYTLKAILDLNLILPVNPRILLVSNEEGGSTTKPIFDIGMEYLDHEGFLKASGAIYGYGGSYSVGIGHRGVARYKLVTHGEAIHTGSVKWQNKERGANAVTAMAEIIVALEDIELPKTSHPSFSKHSNVITPGTMILHGGTAVSTVPDYCETVVDIRYLPGLKIEEVFRKIKQIVEAIAEKRGVRAEIERFVNIPAISLSPTDNIVETVSQACSVIYGKNPGVKGYGPANESFMLIKKGIPTVVFGPLGSGAHADDEQVTIDSLAKTVRVYLQTLATYT